MSDSYREINDEPETFYIDAFGRGQQLDITEVIRSIGGEVEYDREAHHMDEIRPRYKITLPIGCEHAGLDEYMDPQTITLPGGPSTRKLCLYPRDESVLMTWLPGDSANVALWHGAKRLSASSDSEDEEQGQQVQATDIVRPHLVLDTKHLPSKTASFVDTLSQFIATPETPVQWLKISNLRMMAQSLRQDYQHIDGLLAILEERNEA